MIINYSAENHRGNELIKNLGNSTLAKSPITKDQFDNRFSYPNPTLTNADGAILTIDNILFIQTGKLIIFELNIEYDNTSNTNNATISGFTAPANGKFCGCLYEGVNTTHSYEVFFDNSDVLQIFSNGVAVQNIALANKTFNLKMGYIVQ